MLAAELVAPMGGVIISDQAEAMLAGARERAAELGLSNVEFQVLNAEWIDLPVASVDAVLCRWGYMLMADPAAALAETRRVLRPGGRLALAVWDALERNPWALAPGAGADRARPRARARRAGAARRARSRSATPRRVSRAARARRASPTCDVEALELARRHASFEELWETTLDLSPQLPRRRALAPGGRDRARSRASLAERFAPYTRRRRHARDTRAHAGRRARRA